MSGALKGNQPVSQLADLLRYGQVCSPSESSILQLRNNLLRHCRFNCSAAKEECRAPVRWKTRPDPLQRATGRLPMLISSGGIDPTFQLATRHKPGLRFQE